MPSRDAAKPADCRASIGPGDSPTPTRRPRVRARDPESSCFFVFSKNKIILKSLCGQQQQQLALSSPQKQQPVELGIFSHSSSNSKSIPSHTASRVGGRGNRDLFNFLSPPFACCTLLYVRTYNDSQRPQLLLNIQYILFPI